MGLRLVRQGCEKMYNGSKKGNGDNKDASPENFLQELERGGMADARVFVVYGEDGYYRDLIAAAIVKRVFQDAPEEDREITIFEKNPDPIKLEDAVNNYPLFTGHALVVIQEEQLFAPKPKKKEEDNKETGAEPAEVEEREDKDEEEGKGKPRLEPLVAVLTNVPDYCTVLFNVSRLDERTALYKRLAKTAKICGCNYAKFSTLQGWLNEQARRHGARFEWDAIKYFEDYLAPLNKNAPLLLLKQELEKLAVYASPRKVWTRADVENVFAALPDAAAFSLMRLMAEGRLVAFLRVLSLEKKKGTYILPICGQILSKLRDLIRYRELKQKGYANDRIASEMDKKYGVSGLAREARNFTLPALKEALLAVAALNRDIRKGGRDFDLLEEIIIRLFSASKRR